MNPEISREKGTYPETSREADTTPVTGRRRDMSLQIHKTTGMIPTRVGGVRIIIQAEADHRDVVCSHFVDSPDLTITGIEVITKEQVIGDVETLEVQPERETLNPPAPRGAGTVEMKHAVTVKTVTQPIKRVMVVALSVTYGPCVESGLTRANDGAMLLLLQGGEQWIMEISLPFQVVVI